MNSKAIFLFCLFLFCLFIVMAVSITVQSGDLDGTVSKSKIVREANAISGQSAARVRKVLDKRTGAIYELGHRWQQHTEAHNKQVFEILPTPS